MDPETRSSEPSLPPFYAFRPAAPEYSHFWNLPIPGQASMTDLSRVRFRENDVYISMYTNTYMYIYSSTYIYIYI